MSNKDIKENIGFFTVLSDEQICAQQTVRQKAAEKAERLISRLSNGEELSAAEWEEILASEGED